MPKRYKSFVIVSHDVVKKCCLCEFTTQSATAIRLHEKFIHGKIATKANTNYDYECTRCLKKFDTEKKLDIHLRTHKIRIEK